MDYVEWRTDSVADRTGRVLTAASWTILAVTVPGCALLPAPWGGGPESITGGAMLPTFFVLLILQVVTGIAAGRRQARGVLLAALVFWGIGSLQYSDASASNLVDTPTPGVTYFMVAYILITVYLLTDVPRQGTPSTGIWLDAGIVAGGAACFAGSLLIVTSTYTQGTDAGRLVALVYPVLDLVLGIIVILQAGIGVRPRRPMTFALIAAFGFLFASDVFLAQGIFQGMYVRRPWVDVICGIGLQLLVWAACRARRPGVAQQGERRLDRTPITASLGAAFIGLIVVMTVPTAADTSFVLVPALITLLAGQVRMWLALREARGAREARALSLTDELTGLPNRRALIARVSAELARDRPLSLLMLDLDGFKEINDGLGHNAGDTLLRLAGERIRATVPEDILVARLGGDEFALALPIEDDAHVLELARTVLANLRSPYAVDGVQLTVEGSIGITVRTATDSEATDLLRRADVAMYQAKETRSGPLLYDAGRDEFSRDRLELVDALRRGIGEGQIEVWYQPQVDAGTCRPSGLEALVRWRHPTEGLIPPIRFLPAARRSGLMMRLSEEIVRQVVADVARWGDDGPAPRVSINVAPPELLGKLFVPFLLDRLRESGLAPESVVLEVTEDSFVSDPFRARDVLEGLAAEGIGVSIDDYGTGFSSLAYLRDLPVEELKIDRSFVRAVDTDERSRMIVSSTASLARALSMRVVAEGVENALVAATLRDLGIDVLQGYHLARPMPYEEVRDWWRGAEDGVAAYPEILPAVTGASAETVVPAQPGRQQSHGRVGDRERSPVRP